MAIQHDFLLGNGKVQQLLQSLNWPDALFAHASVYSEQFDTALQLTLASSQPAALLWGTELLFLYNDAYIELLGNRHPQSLGRPFLDVCHDIRHLLEPCIKNLMEGKPCFMENLPFNIVVAEHSETAVLTLSFIPLRNKEGQVVGAFNLGVDNTRRMQAEKRFQKIVDQAATGVVETNAEGEMSLVNKKFCSMLGYSAEELLGKSIVEITAPNCVTETMNAVASLFSGGPDVILEKQYMRKDGSFMWATSSVSALRGPAGEAEGIVAIVVDITERKLAEEKIRHASHHDLLTGLPNRAMLFEYAHHLLPHNRRNSLKAAAFFIDLDRFKPINDTHGHEVGDVVLKQVAGRLAGCLREEDIVIRLGGDEFVILLQEIDDTVYAVDVACHIISKINKPFHIGELTLSLSISVGISIFPEDGQDIDMLISHADMAMYQAKQAGRNNFQFYSAEYAEKTKMQIAIEQQLKSALNIGNFHLCYQPVVDIQSRAVVSVEALLRWRFEEIGPERFVPVAESTGIINSIGQWLLAEASRQHKTWIEHGLPAIPIAVNVSVVEFRDKEFANRFEKIIREHGIGAHALQLEVTETAVMEDIEHTAKVLTRLQTMGVKILLDDFGTGHSSLAYLARLPLNKVKIDKSFVMPINKDLVSRAITNAMIALARTVNLEVVAEGVESESVLEYLGSQGCGQAQGYYLGKPMSGEFFESWYWENSLCVKCSDENIQRLH